MRWFQMLVGTLALAACGVGNAQSTFRITELFSNQDGSIQFIRLSETAGRDDQNNFQGLTIRITAASGTRTYTFPRALATTATAGATVIVGIGTIFELSSCCIAMAQPDFNFPERFLPTEGGTIEFGDIDAVTYPALPVDGANAWYRDGSVGVGVLPRSSCAGRPPSCPSVIHPTPGLVTAVEFYNAQRDHYFTTAFASDIDALDSRRLPGWQRTGESFAVGAHAITRLGLEYEYVGTALCRFYLPPARGDSHFLSASADECEGVAAHFPDAVLETSAAFYAALPNDPTTGQCGVMPGFIDGNIALRPVFRLWNARVDSNHRYTTRLESRAEMLARGWVSEGYGDLGTVMCVY